jgi:hypothetical protein
VPFLPIPLFLPSLCKVRTSNRPKSYLTRPERETFSFAKPANRTRRPLGEEMKRTATTLILLAGFGGGCVSPAGPGPKNEQPSTGGFGTVTRPQAIPGVQGPGGEPVAMSARGNVTPAAGYASVSDKSSGVQQALYKPGATSAVLPGGYMTSGSSSNIQQVGYHGPTAPPNTGIMPVPGMGPPGAVAAVGSIGPGMQQAPTNQRSSILFTGLAGMKITWQTPGGGFNDEASGLTAPKAYNFMQGQVYRLRLSQILPNFPGRTFYPTLEVVPANPKTITFLAHSSVPVSFTNEDFDQVVAGNLVVKVIYLPDRDFQDLAALPGVDEIVSTRLEAGADPIAEAQRRGSILAIIRLGNIDLENRSSPAMTAPPAGFMVPPGGMMMRPPVATTTPSTVALQAPTMPPPPLAKPTSPTAPAPFPATTGTDGRPSFLPTLTR